MKAASILLTLALAASTAHAAKPKAPIALEPVAEPRGEHLAAPVGTIVLLGTDNDDQAHAITTLKLTPRPVELAFPQDDGFLVASMGGKRLWKKADYPAAGGSEAVVFGRADRRVVFVGQSRIGTWALDALTGKVVQGWDAPVLAPDATWALMLPWFNGFTMCLEAPRPIRIRLDARLAARPVPATPAPKSVVCSDREADGSTVRYAAAIAQAGDRYAVVSVITSPAGAATTRLELFRAADDHRIASVDQGLPAIASLSFSASGDYLALVPEQTDDKPVEAVWYRIAR
ncbi:MAG: hypothetical protein U1F43_19945 [Myxococcota bacterium]